MPPSRPRLLIEDWLPAAAIGVECMRERSTGQQPPDKRLHVWWARRPLVLSRAAVLASLLPADFPREQFERLLGFWGSSKQILLAQRMLEAASARGGARITNPHGSRAFRSSINDDDIAKAHAASKRIFGNDIAVIDPMSGGGSIPLEASRLGFKTYANELNPVACVVLEATIDFPFRFGPNLTHRAQHWADELRKRFISRMDPFFPRNGLLAPYCYIFARTVPCPDTQYATPLVPDWHLLKPKGSSYRLAAEPIVDHKSGTWSVRMREIGTGAGQLKEAPLPTYSGGDGVSIFTRTKITGDYIKAQAQNGKMGSAIYAVAVKTPTGLEFIPPSDSDREAYMRAASELARQRPKWEASNILPTERYPEITSDNRPIEYGMPRWADMFSPRQLLGFGVLSEELNRLRPTISAEEGEEKAGAICLLLASVVDKLLNYNSYLSSWHSTHSVMRSVFDRHDFAFKFTFAEMATCAPGAGLAWAIESVLEAYAQIAELPRSSLGTLPEITQGSAISLGHLDAESITAVVVDPPYADNVQYSELADFFYVWLKRTQGHRRPEWFSTNLCDNSEEAVVNAQRHLEASKTLKIAKAKANVFYQERMTKSFREAHRVLRPEGALTVMFTHKKQEAWEALFSSLISAGFTITATWPVKTESEHSLHQAKKNAAQSTVVLVARKRPSGAGVGYYNDELRAEIRQKARATAERLKTEGLNAVDQLVGSFGPAMEVYSRYDSVKTDTGEVIGVSAAIDEASEAVSQWRIEQLAERGLDGVEPEGKFALLCWDVMGAAEFRFNEASLLGKAVGMEVDTLIAAGLVTKSGDKIKVVPVKERRRDRALEPEEADLLGAPIAGKKRKKVDALKVHPNDPSFRTALDGCHALALRYVEAGGDAGGIGNARELARRQNWQKGSTVARLLEALVHAAPPAVRNDNGKKNSAAVTFPEFRAWHALLRPLFSIEPPDWTPVAEPQFELTLGESAQAELTEESEEDEEGEE